MSLKTVVLTIYYTLKAGPPSIMMIAAGGPILAVLLALAFSPTAAAVVLAVELAVFAAVVIATGRFMVRFLDLKVEPVSDYGPNVDLAAVKRLEEALISLGFTPIGLYRLDLSVQSALVREDLKIYATIHCGAQGLKPHLEYGSLYEGRRFYQISDMNIKSEWFYPPNIVNDNFPGKNPAELLDIFLRKRPEQGLLETPPDNFVESQEMEKQLTREHLLHPPRKK